MKTASSTSHQVASLENGYFDWPVDEAKLSRGFSLEPTGKRRKPHLGIDLAAPKGTAIYASHEGTVIYSGKDFRGFGKMILIEGKSGWATLYAHLTQSHVKEGQQVFQGEQIGDMGRTGRATGSHLHFEIRKMKGPVDPLLFLPNGHAVADEDKKGEPEARLSLLNLEDSTKE